MDFFTEYIIQRKKTGKDYFYIGLILFAFFIVLYMGLVFAPYFGNLFLLYVVGISYGAYFLVRRFNIEYEYIFTNGELDIDRIIAKRSRRRIITVNAREFDFFEPISSDKVKNIPSMGIQRTIHAEGDRKSEQVYVIVLNHKGIKTCLYIQPSKKILDGIRRYLPRRSQFDV